MSESSGKFQVSSRVARIAAYFIDTLILFLIQTPIFLLFSAINSMNGLATVPVIISWGYHWFFTTVKGATPGKMLFNLRVVNFDGTDKIDPLHGFLREVIGKFISGLVLSLGLIWFLWDKNRQGWHDKIAGTRVIQVKPLSTAKKVLAWFLALILPILIIVLFLLGIFMAVTLIALNPAKYFKEAEQTKIKSDINTLQRAIVYYIATPRIDQPDKKLQQLKSLADGVPREIAKSDADICSQLVPEWMVALPANGVFAKANGFQITDCSTDYKTGYVITLDPDINKIVVKCDSAMDCDQGINDAVERLKSSVTITTK